MVLAGLLLWFAAGVLHVVLSRAGSPPGLVGLLAPSTAMRGPARILATASFVGPESVAVFVVVLAALARPVLRARSAGAGARVLGVWFAAIVAGLAPVLVTTATALLRLDHSLLAREGWVTVLAYGYAEPLRTGCAWGLTYGWLVGLAAVALLRRDALAPGGQRRPPQPRPGALVAGVVAGGLSALGWLLAAAADSLVVDALARSAPTTGREPGTTLLLELAWTLPVTTAAGRPFPLVLLSGVLVGVVVGALTWLAVRGTDRTARLLPFLGVWAAAVVGTGLGALPTALAGHGSSPQGDERWMTVQSLLRSPTDGGAAGALGGWVPALAVLAVLAWLGRAAPVEDAPVEDAPTEHAPTEPAPAPADGAGDVSRSS